jgi:hypothetical protein
MGNDLGTVTEVQFGAVKGSIEGLVLGDRESQRRCSWEAARSQKSASSLVPRRLESCPAHRKRLQRQASSSALALAALAALQAVCLESRRGGLASRPTRANSFG